MTRPRKQTVDWFPHSCSHGRTMFVLERRWGIAGYGFWFKLLEILGNTEGHFIDADNQATMDYLQAYTYTDKETCFEILNQLANLEAIDPKLWEEKIIWSDNFVKGLAPCYRNRNIEIPVRPDNYRKKPGPGGINDTNKRKKPVEEGEEGEEEKEGEKNSRSASPPMALFSKQDLAVLWNEKAPPELPRVNLPFTRKEKDMVKIRDALKRHPEKEWWERVILLLWELPFVRGTNDRGWKITLDVMVRDADLILDGKYAGRKTGVTGQNVETLKRFMER